MREELLYVIKNFMKEWSDYFRDGEKFQCIDSGEIELSKLVDVLLEKYDITNKEKSVL